MKSIYKYLLFVLIVLSSQCRPNYVNRFEVKKIALDTLDKRFGIDMVNSNKPYHVYSRDSIWIVQTYRRKPIKGISFTVVISKKKGEIINSGLGLEKY